MMKRKLAMCLIGFLLSCGTDPEPAEPEIPVVIPAGRGNWWDYQVVTLNNAGDTLRIANQRMQLTDSIAVNGLYAYRVANLIPSWLELFGLQVGYLLNGAGGLYLGFVSAGDPIDPNEKPQPVFYRYLKVPAAINDRQPIPEGSVITTALNATVEVPYGLVSCMQYAMVSGQDTLVHLWLKPGVGIIRVIELRGSTRLESNLIAMHLKS